MKSAIFVVLGTVMLLAQEAVPLPDRWEWVERVGAIGILGFAVAWYMTRTIPAMQRDHRELIAVHKAEREVLAANLLAERDKFLERMDRWAEGAREDSRNLNQTLCVMAEHCRTVSAKFSDQAGK